jgi:hypothetical protein
MQRANAERVSKVQAPVQVSGNRARENGASFRPILLSSLGRWATRGSVQ